MEQSEHSQKNMSFLFVIKKTMGVPGLFYWIQQRHAQYTKNIQKGKNTVENLYVDAVCFVHQCAQDVYGYGKNVSFSETYASFTEKQKEQEVFRMTRNAIFALTKYVTPTKKFYVVFDGVAPIAKQNQQRHRRFLGGKPSCGFDPNSITCGTEFLDRLQRYVERGLSNFCQNEKFSLVFSSSSQPGEGEHKALAFARANGNGESHCFYSPDGDLVLLTMALGFENVSLLRQDHIQQWKYLLTDISGLSQEFQKDVPIKDFVFLSCLLGNDFLPRLGMFESKFSDTAEFLIAKYKEYGKRIFSEKTGNFIPARAFGLFSFLSTFEKELFDKRCVFELTAQKEGRTDHTLLESYSPQGGVDVERYKQIFGSKKQREDSQAFDYVRGCIWVTVYYFRGCPDNGWSYKWHYPPFLSDIKKEHFTGQKPFKHSVVPNQLLQLLCVLPPHSMDLLPKRWKKYSSITKKEELSEFFPKEVEIDYEGKFREYENVPLLPHVDVSLIQREIQKIQ